MTGAGDAFCAGADLKTFIPPRIAALDRAQRARQRRHRPGRPDPGPAPHLQAGDRRGQRLGARRAGSRPRSHATSGSPRSARCSGPSRCGAGSTTATAASRGWSTPAARASPSRCCSPASRSTPSARCSATSCRGSCRTSELMEEAEQVAQPDPAQQPDRRALREGDDPRRDRPAADDPSAGRVGHRRRYTGTGAGRLPRVGCSGGRRGSCPSTQPRGRAGQCTSSDPGLRRRRSNPWRPGWVASSTVAPPRSGSTPASARTGCDEQLASTSR